MKKQAPGKGKTVKILLLLAAFVLLCASFWQQNNSLQTTRANYASARLPAGFDGYTIVQLSDLHSKRFGQEQGRLLAAVAAEEPDLIVLTGDMIDRRRYDAAPALELVRGAAALAPVYYVPGNHEAWSGHYETLRAQLAEAGAHILEDEEALLTSAEGGRIALRGLMDPGFFARSGDASLRADAKARLEAWAKPSGFTILLFHRPELLELYAQSGVDLAFCGHAHGGQIRLPGLGGLYAPGQGFLPAYTSGSHAAGGVTMFVSRGLGNSIFPLRLFNRPELVVVRLVSAAQGESPLAGA